MSSSRCLGQPLSGADPGFPVEEANSPGGRQHKILLKFQKKLHEILDHGGGGGHAGMPPLRSTTDTAITFQAYRRVRLNLTVLPLHISMIVQSWVQLL